MAHGAKSEKLVKQGVLTVEELTHYREGSRIKRANAHARRKFKANYPYGRDPSGYPEAAEQQELTEEQTEALKKYDRWYQSRRYNTNPDARKRSIAQKKAKRLEKARDRYTAKIARLEAELKQWKDAASHEVDQRAKIWATGWVAGFDDAKKARPTTPNPHEEKRK